MINSFVTIIKLQKMNITTQDLTDMLFSSFLGSSNSYCRKCNAQNLELWCKYTRKLTDLKNGKVINYDLETWRFRCSSCKSTHAFLVPFIIPYGRFSILVVIKVLYEYFSTGSVVKVCEKYDISIPTLYRWKALFLKHKEEWLGCLKNAETSAASFLRFLIEDEDYSKFILQFMQSRPDRKTFLQNHRNANNQRFVRTP